MYDYSEYERICPTVYADLLKRENVMGMHIQPMCKAIGTVAGPAFVVQCPPGDILMLHKAIYLAQPGSIIVVKAGDNDYAVLGGNFVNLAKQQGIKAIIVEGAIRDIVEVRACGLPVFASGISPIPGARKQSGQFQQTIQCGGALVSSGDCIVADEEGIVVIEKAHQDKILAQAKARDAKEKGQSFADWQAAHLAMVDATWQPEHRARNSIES